MGAVEAVPPRPYALVEGSEPSVTTILEAMLAKPGMAWAAARETAKFMDLHRSWEQWDPSWRISKLGRHHRGVWDGRAAVGTAVHRVNQSWVAGVEVDLGDLVEELAAEEPKAREWRGRTDEAVDILTPYVDALERFWDDFTPVASQAEGVVRMPGVYIGTWDWTCALSDAYCLLDIKTTANETDGKGLYADSWTLQLAALAHAPESVTYRMEQGLPVEASTEPWTQPEQTMILHLRSTGRYDLYRLRADKDAHDNFHALALIYQYLRNVPRPEKVSHVPDS